MPGNEIFIKHVKSAVHAHENWLKSLTSMVESQKVEPLQTNPRKCVFGHFYYAMKPANPEVVHIWKKLEGIHGRFHDYGKTAIAAIQNKEFKKAEQARGDAFQLSKELISSFQEIIRMVEALDKNHKNVFEA
jgi:hypothetical protein